MSTEIPHHRNKYESFPLSVSNRKTPTKSPTIRDNDPFLNKKIMIPVKLESQTVKCQKTKQDGQSWLILQNILKRTAELPRSNFRPLPHTYCQTLLRTSIIKLPLLQTTKGKCHKPGQISIITKSKSNGIDQTNQIKLSTHRIKPEEVGDCGNDDKCWVRSTSSPSWLKA